MHPSGVWIRSKVHYMRTAIMQSVAFYFTLCAYTAPFTLLFLTWRIARLLLIISPTPRYLLYLFNNQSLLNSILLVSNFLFYFCFQLYRQIQLAFFQRVLIYFEKLAFKLLSYFFDHEYLLRFEIKLYIYFHRFLLD